MFNVGTADQEKAGKQGRDDTRSLVGHGTLENEWYVATGAHNPGYGLLVAIRAFKFERFFVLSYITCPCYPYILSLPIP